MTRLVFIFLIATLVVIGAAAEAAPKSELWDKWSKHDPNSTQLVDHSAWDAFVKKYVEDNPEGLNQVNYSNVSESDRKALDGYLAHLAATPVSSLNQPEQMVYWINLYNALTLDVILEHHPVKSIRDIDISPGLFSDGPWSKKLMTIEGEEVSLDDIEHRILRPIWKDPRIHYAVNCASVGCPDLIAKAYVASETEVVLEANAIAYINSPRGARIKDGELTVSSIYDWFQEDFGGNEKGVLAHLAKYAKGDLKAAIANAKSIDDYDYDWTLNGR